MPDPTDQTDIAAPAQRTRSVWWIVVCGGVVLACSHGLIISAFGAYLVAINADTGWDPRVVAVSYSLVQLGNGVLAPVAGWFCDRLGTRVVSLTGALIAGSGFLAASQVHGGSQFVAAAVLIALGGAGIGIMPATVAVVRAFTARRTLAIGLLSTGVAVGGLIVPAVVFSLEQLGWRATFVVTAIVLAAVGVVSAVVFGHPSLRVRRREQPVELPEYGVSGEVAGAGKAVNGAAPAQSGYRLGPAVRTSAFWLLVGGHGSALIAVGAVNLHLVPLLSTEHGHSLRVGGLAVAAMAVSQLIGQVAVGVVGDRWDKRGVAVGCMLAHSLALVTLATVADLGLVLTAVVVHGLAWGLRGPVMTTLRAEYFGYHAFGSILGLSMGLVSIGMTTGPVLAAAIAAGPGGYPAAFTVLSLVTAAGALAFVVLRPPRGFEGGDQDARQRAVCRGSGSR